MIPPLLTLAMTDRRIRSHCALHVLTYLHVCCNPDSPVLVKCVAVGGILHIDRETARRAIELLARRHYVTVAGRTSIGSFLIQLRDTNMRTPSTQWAPRPVPEVPRVA